MSGRIFFLAICVIVATICLVYTFDTYINDNVCIVISTVCVGILLSLSLFAMSMLFTSIKHIQACMKYDHVIVYDVFSHNTQQINREKIIYRNDYVDGRNNPYSYIILAWNDEDAKNASYDDLVK